MLAKFFLGLALVGACHGIFEDCDYYEKLQPNRPYFLYSPEYPEKYPPGKSCRWYLVSPPKTKINLVCEDFYIPPSEDCRLDRLGVSRDGKIDLSDVRYYCGKGKLDIVSNDNLLNVVLLTVSYSPGGSFFCSLEVKENHPPPVPPDNPLCNCGYTNPMRIVGGTETGVNEFPMMSGLVDAEEEELFCGSTIISQKFALTAAHCLSDRTPQKVGLLVGDHDISILNETDSAKIYRVEGFYKHPDYNPLNFQNDIGLVSVRGKIMFRREVAPACLPMLNARDSFSGETVLALGWGATSFTGPDSDQLLSAPLGVITLEQCKPTYGDRITEKQMCTYMEEKDACQSDSGGPLLWKDPHAGVTKVVGVISYGIHCGTTYPSVNTRVTSYMDWIKETTHENFCVL